VIADAVEGDLKIRKHFLGLGGVVAQCHHATDDFLLLSMPGFSLGHMPGRQLKFGFV
jgi:hypothetical protein